jgi:hypothetical protein
VYLHIENEQALKEALLDGTAIAISDGLHKDSFGTAAWTIGDLDNIGLISGQAVCPGAAEDMDSYWSELAGIYCIMVVFQKLCFFHDFQEGTIELGCDGLSTLDSVFEKGVQLLQDIPSYDLVAAILCFCRSSCLSWRYRYVKGHQDEGSGVLDSWAMGNILMDSRTKQHLSHAMSSPRHFLIQGEPWKIWLGNKKLTSKIQSHIYSLVQDEDGAQYWMAKLDSSSQTVNLVDWKAISLSMKGIKRGRRVFVTKHVVGMCGVGKFMKRWRQWDTDQCPRCGDSEDAQHVWICKAASANDIWSKAIDSIELTLCKLNMEPTLQHTRLLYLKGWHSGETIRS